MGLSWGKDVATWVLLPLPLQVIAMNPLAGYYHLLNLMLSTGICLHFVLPPQLPSDTTGNFELALQAHARSMCLCLGTCAYLKSIRVCHFSLNLQVVFMQTPTS